MADISAPAAGPSGGMKGHLKNRAPSGFKIQITSMVDMFVILLVFLLKSYSTSPIQVTPTKDLRLPSSASTTEPVDVVKLVVSKQGIFVEDARIVDLKDGQITEEVLDGNDSSFIPLLYKALDDHAQKLKGIAQVNQTVEFDGRILMQADKDLNYHLLQKVMYTSMMAGYSDIKLAVSER